MTKNTVIAEPKVVLVKFQFTNRNLIPAGIKKVKRDDKQLEDDRDENSITTGCHTEGENVNIRPFVAQLFKSGYFLADAHYYTKYNKHNVKYTLVLSFNKNKPLVKLPKEAKLPISQLINDAWSFCHFWRNPNCLWSLTCLHRIPLDQIGNLNIGELFFEAPNEKEPKKYIYEKL